MAIWVSEKWCHDKVIQCIYKREIFVKGTYFTSKVFDEFFDVASDWLIEQMISRTRYTWTAYPQYESAYEWWDWTPTRIASHNFQTDNQTDVLQSGPKHDVSAENLLYALNSIDYIPLPVPRRLFGKLHTRRSSHAAQYGCPALPACKTCVYNRNVDIWSDFSDFSAFLSFSPQQLA